MTTQANPDGQTQHQASDDAGAGDGGGGTSQQDWRNHDDVKKAFKSRDEAKAAAKAAAAELAEVKARLAAIESEKMKADGNLSGLLDAEQTARKAAEAKAAELETAVQERTRQDRRREIVDAILDGAHPQRKDELRLMLAGLHESGELDLYAEDPKAESRKALDKLRKRLPSYFTPGNSSTGATPQGPGRDLSQVDWMQLTPEEQRSVSPEDFRRYFAGRGAGNRRGGSALFGNQPTTRK